MILSKLEKIKISLLCNGINITDNAYNKLTDNNRKPISINDYVTTSGLLLILPGNIYVNAGIKKKYILSDNNSETLDYDDIEKSFFIITVDSEKIYVECLPIPVYYNTAISTGKKASQIVMNHSDRVRISPIIGCKNSCYFCDANSKKYEKNTFPEIKEAMNIAFYSDEEKCIKHILISGGSPKPNDKNYLEEIYHSILNYSALNVDIMLEANNNFDIIYKLKDWGCFSLSINLEIFDSKLAEKIMPEKFAIGRTKYINFIAKAVEVFSNNQIRSCIIAGIESIESTLEAVKILSEIGCIPVLSPFITSEKIKLKNYNKPDVDFLSELYEKAYEIIRKNGLYPGPRCIPCQHNVIAFPSDNDFYFFS